MRSTFNGNRLRKARIYRELTLTELAELFKKTTITKQSISSYENGKSIPDFKRIREIAKVLGFPNEYFFQEDSDDVKAKTTYFRSQSTATKKKKNSQKVKLEFIADIYEVLQKYIEFPIFNDMDIDFRGADTIEDCNSKETINEIEIIAQKVRKAWNLGNGPINNLQYILEQHGILVTYLETDDEAIDAFSQRTQIGHDVIYFVAISKGKVYECRIRFDMAHELGHIILHPWSEDLEAISKDEFRAREKQANMFASSFLLPKHSFSQDISAYPTSLEYYVSLKKKWGVSIQAMLYRAHQLGIITVNQYQYLMRQVSKRGWRKQEPQDVPYTINESIFQGAIDLLFENNIFDPDSLMQEFEYSGISFYPETIEKLLYLRTGTLKEKNKNTTLFSFENIKRNYL